MSEFDNFLSNLEAYLDLEAEEGFSQLQVTPDALRYLDMANKRDQVSAKSDLNMTQKTQVRNNSQRYSGKDRGDALNEIAAQIESCKACPLHKDRIQTVPGEGPIDPDIMFVGEGPGTKEDEQGRPFVGRSGKLLTKMIQAMGYQREDVFIGNIVKCHPINEQTGRDRPPYPDERETCLPYLRKQIEIINPKVIIALGKTSVEGLLGRQIKITQFRGTWQKYAGIDLMPTYHPSFLLRQAKRKKEVWEDLKAVLRHIGRPVPGKDKPKS